ncbi:hypothetical protein A9Q87_07500 [Flavobacteriales bacterium 34_180_T64]|nr:hypothetical protein A9Q87_07500 [Flavobacteriales bacterium 34_180_T64]
MPKKLVLVCLINFLIAALMGLALRYTSIDPIPINYKFLTHGHSHVAMLGWVYLMLFTLIVHYFIKDKKQIYNRLFWLTEFAVIGMMISFPIQGYAAVSISFSTLHIFCSYYFAYLVWKHHNTSSIVTRHLLRTALVFMLLSTLGVWCLGPAVALLGSASAFYQIAIQFFLHFQFNGWFLIAVIAVFFHLLQIQDSKLFRLFYKTLILSIFLSLALPIHWYAPHSPLFWINAFGVILQLISFVLFFKLIVSKLNLVLKHNTKLSVHVYTFAIVCFGLKMGLQVLSLIPEISQSIYQHRNVVIGFIHLTLLGAISGFLLSFIIQSRLVTYTKGLYLGVYIFILGFVITELLLIIQGYKFHSGSGLIANYYLLLFLSSMLLPIGILSIVFNIYKTPSKAP